MEPIHVVLIIIFSLIALTLSAAFVCFMLTFYSGKRKPLPEGEYDFPTGKIYEEFHGDIMRWQDSLRGMSAERVETVSYDGLTLRGKYYEYKKGAPLEIMFHGYKGNAFRDLCGAVERCFKLGRNALIVDQRAHGESEGHVITFGYKERFDCLTWIKFAAERFGKDQKILITGISMGASTVLMAAGEDLPENVVSVLADCPFSSTKGIICKVIRDMHLPSKPIYAFIRLGAILFGGFDPNKCEPIDAVKRCKIPIIFIHGDGDDFVPSYMSEQMHGVCPTEKAIFVAKGAGHGLAFLKDADGYYRAVREFDKKING